MMTFQEAVALMKTFSPSGDNLLDGLENVDGLLRDLRDGLCDDDILTETEKAAYRIVCREMRKLFV